MRCVTILSPCTCGSVHGKAAKGMDYEKQLFLFWHKAVVTGEKIHTNDKPLRLYKHAHNLILRCLRWKVIRKMTDSSKLFFSPNAWAAFAALPQTVGVLTQTIQIWIFAFLRGGEMGRDYFTLYMWSIPNLLEPPRATVKALCGVPVESVTEISSFPSREHRTNRNNFFRATFCFHIS